MKRTALSIIFALSAIIAMAQTGLKKVYDETINPMTQIDEAVAQAKASNGEKFVICQVGGNWCPWCLRFANFISKDADIMKLINENFIYIHVNYNPRKAKGANQADAAALMQRLNNPQRFGFPVFVVLDDGAHTGFKFPGGRTRLQQGEGTSLPQGMDARCCREECRGQYFHSKVKVSRPSLLQL